MNLHRMISRSRVHHSVGSTVQSIQSHFTFFCRLYTDRLSEHLELQVEGTTSTSLVTQLTPISNCQTRVISNIKLQRSISRTIFSLAGWVPDSQQIDLVINLTMIMPISIQPITSLDIIQYFLYIFERKKVRHALPKCLQNSIILF